MPESKRAVALCKLGVCTTFLDGTHVGPGCGCECHKPEPKGQTAECLGPTTGVMLGALEACAEQREAHRIQKCVPGDHLNEWLLLAEKRGFERAVAQRSSEAEAHQVAIDFGYRQGAHSMRERAAKFAENRKGGSGATGSGIYAESEILRFQEEALQIVADEIRALPLDVQDHV